MDRIEALQRSLETKTRMMRDLRESCDLKISAFKKSLAARDKIIAALKKQVKTLEEENEYLFEEYSKGK
jgi:hypothetical protein